MKVQTLMKLGAAASAMAPVGGEEQLEWRKELLRLPVPISSLVVSMAMGVRDHSWLVVRRQLFFRFSDNYNSPLSLLIIPPTVQMG